MTLLARLGVVLVVAIGTASCTDDKPESEPTEDGAPIVQLGGPGEDGRTMSPEELAGIPEPTWTDADVEFVEMMIPHHEQALELTALVGDRAADPDLRVMAERIEVSQADEIQMMEDWLDDRQTDEKTDGHGSDHGEHGSAGGDEGDDAEQHDHADMPGMLSPEQLDELEAAAGERFDQLFLQSMIRHHEGAIMMVETLLGGDEGGLESEIFQIASHIGSDQAVEIASMKRQLTKSKI